MSKSILPVSAKDVEILKTLNRIASALERLADSAAAANHISEDSNRYLCSTIASLHDYQPKPPAKGRGRA